MAITNAICNSFKLECANGIHNMSSDVFKVALYSSAATLNKDTTAYSTVNEISAASYPAGGWALTTSSGFPSIVSDKMEMRFDDMTKPNQTFSARGAVIYNSSKSNRAVAVIDFGIDMTPQNGPFTIAFPSGNPAIISFN